MGSDTYHLHLSLIRTFSDLSNSSFSSTPATANTTSNDFLTIYVVDCNYNSKQN